MMLKQTEELQRARETLESAPETPIEVIRDVLIECTGMEAGEDMTDWTIAVPPEWAEKVGIADTIRANPDSGIRLAASFFPDDTIIFVPPVTFQPSPLSQP